MSRRPAAATAVEGHEGWDEYAPFYDWENARTLGRRDVPAYRFASDLDAGIAADLVSRRGELHGGLPAPVDSELADAGELSQRLHAVLQRLPGDVRRLLDLHVLSDGAYRRVAADVEGLSAPLEDLAMAIARVQSEATSRHAGLAQLEDRLVAAMVTACRNRLGVAPKADAKSRLPAVLSAVLGIAAEREPLLAAVRDRVTPAYLGRLLAEHGPRLEARTVLELVDDDGLLLVPEHHRPETVTWR